MTNSYDSNSGGMFATLENSCGFDHIYDKHRVNPYFNWVNNTNEQTLGDILVAEAIINRGVECIYIRRQFKKIDLVFGEDPLSKFSEHFRISLYVESFDGWEGDGDWYSKFGYQVNDEMNICVNPKLFEKQGDGIKPNAGDLIYFPMSNGLFEVSWVENEDPWHMNGGLPMRKLKMVKFVYSGEEIALEKTDDTVDSIEDILSFGMDSDDTFDVGRINDLSDQWDTGIEQGEEMTQLADEFSAFDQGQQKSIPTSDIIPPPPIGFGANTNNPFG